MNTKIMRVVVTLFLNMLSISLITSTQVLAAEGLDLRPLINIRLNQLSESSQLVPEKALVTRRLVAPTEVSASAEYVSVGVALYPEFDRIPIVLEKVKFIRASFTVWTVAKDGTLGYTSFNDSGMSAFAHESGGTSGFVFTTASRTTITPNSPSGGSFRNVIVENVGAIYLSRKNLNFGSFPKWAYPKTDEGYQIDFAFDLEVTYNGITKRIVVNGDSGLTAKYLVSNKTPEIASIKPATGESAEVVATIGEDVRQFRMKWSSELGSLSEWQLILPPPTVQILSEGLAEWVLPEMPVSPARYYVLEWTPEPQFYVPQFPVYSPDTTVGIAEMAMKGLFP